MANKTLLVFLVAVAFWFSGCGSAKYLAPHMVKLDTNDVKIVSQESIKDGIYFDMNPKYKYKIHKDSSLELTKHSVTVTAYTKQQYEKKKNELNNIWAIYGDDNKYAIPNSKISVDMTKSKYTCSFYKNLNIYVCGFAHFTHGENNYLDKNVVRHIIEINRETLNEEGAKYKKWLLAGFDNFKNARKWMDIGKTPKEAKLWIHLGISPLGAEKYNFSEYIEKVHSYNISNKEIQKWIKVGMFNPAIVNFLKYNKLTIDSFKNKSLKEILNNMSMDDFFKMMGITDMREINGYVYHWKYNTNYKRFFHILKKDYGIY